MGGRGNDGNRGSSAITEAELQSALQKLDKLKPLRRNNPDIVHSPIDMGIENGVVKANQILLNPDLWDRSTGKMRTVDPKDLYTNQSYVVRSGVRNTLTKEVPHEYANPPTAIEIDGRLWLSDGNHRATAALLLGKPIKVKVYKLKKGN